MKGFYREIKIQGLNLERLLLQAAAEGISTAHIKRRRGGLTLWVQEKDVSRMLDLAERGGWKAAAGPRRGVGRGLDKLVQRWMVAACVALGLMIVCLAHQLVWGIEISGAGVYQADVEAYLNMWPVRPLTWKNHIDLKELQNALEWRYPEVAWVECGWRGPVLSVNMKQGVPQGETVTLDGAGEIIASRDGIVESIVTLAGTPVVKQGDVVRAGQTLIRGEERISAEEATAVMAQGIVKARVWDSVALRMPAKEIATQETGRHETVWNVVCPWFILLKEQRPAMEAFDMERKRISLGGIFFPFVLQKETYREISTEKRPADRAALEQEARSAALRLLSEKAGNCDDFVDKWVDCCMIEDEVLEVVAVGERIMDIAKPLRYGD